jgi:SMC interacting uncharacterized protein involved in chromosome segregation
MALLEFLENNNFANPSTLTLTVTPQPLSDNPYPYPRDLAMALLEFLEDNNFDNPKAPKQRNIDSSKDFERQVAIAEGIYVYIYL